VDVLRETKLSRRVGIELHKLHDCELVGEPQFIAGFLRCFRQVALKSWTPRQCFPNCDDQNAQEIERMRWKRAGGHRNGYARDNISRHERGEVAAMMKALP